MNYVAIDFETANNFRRSACALGVCVVEDGRIVEQRDWRFRPDPFEVGWYQYAVHGLSLEDLSGEPSFADSWEEVRPYLEKYTLVAHNAAFDGSVLHHLFDLIGLSGHPPRVACTMRMARTVWPQRISYGLDYLAAKNKNDFTHHNAGSDAYACARLAYLLGLESGMSDFAGWPVYSGPGRARKTDYLRELLDTPALDADPDHVFYEKEIVFTGTLKNFTRDQAHQMVHAVGARPAKGVTKTTNFLVFGHQDSYRVGDDLKSNKQEKAEALIRQGHDLQLLSESEFLKLILP